MRRAFLLILLAVLTVPLGAVTATWDANPENDIAGYRLRWGTVSGIYPQVLDVGNVTSTTQISLTPGVRYYFVIQAYNATGQASAFTAEVPFDMPQPTIDPACAFPLGNRSVSIFPTAVQRAGAKARLDFQLSSPGSPITSVVVKGNGNALSTMNGTDVTALAGIWFSVPTAPGSYALSIFAGNAYSCSKEVTTPYTVVVP